MNNIVITGFAGTGKSTVAKRLARTISYPYVDMDALIEERQERPISRIFAESGEGFFRQLESELCQELATWRNHVIATGGGTLVNPANLATLSEDNMVVCLDCEPDELWQRLEHATDRPLLNSDDQEAKKAALLSLLHEREAAYARIPLHVDTTRRSLEEIVGEILRKVEHESH